MDSKFAHLVRLFGSRAAVAHAAGVDKSAVHRWPPRKGISVEKQARILARARDLGMPIDQVAWALDVQRCECCNQPISREIRDIISTH